MLADGDRTLVYGLLKGRAGSMCLIRSMMSCGVWLRPYPTKSCLLLFFFLRAPFGQYGPVAAFELYLYTAVDSRPGPGGSRTEELPAAEPTHSTEWVERAPLPRKRQPEKSWTPHPPEPQRAKPADAKPVPQAGPWTPHPPAPKQGSPAAAKPVPQAVSGPAVPVQQAMPHSVTLQAAVRTQHDDIRQRLFSDSVQRSRRCCVAVLPMAFGPEADSSRGSTPLWSRARVVTW